MKVRVRELDFEKQEEVAWAARVHCEAPRHWDPDWDTTSGIPRVQARIEGLRGDLNHLALVAESASGELIGLHWLMIEELSPSQARYTSFRVQDDERFHAQVLSLWVREDHWGKDIARELKLRGEKWARSRGATRISTSVHSRNQRMLELNFKAGFEAGNIAMSKLL